MLAICKSRKHSAKVCLCSLPTKSVQEILVKEIHVTSTHAQHEENANQAGDCSFKITTEVK